MIGVRQTADCALFCVCLLVCLFALGKKQPTTMHTHSISRENTASERTQSRPKHSHVIEIFVRGFLYVISFTFALTARCYAVCAAHRNACQSFFGGGCVRTCRWVGGGGGISSNPCGVSLLCNLRASILLQTVSILCYRNTILVNKFEVHRNKFNYIKYATKYFHNATSFKGKYLT